MTSKLRERIGTRAALPGDPNHSLVVAPGRILHALGLGSVKGRNPVAWGTARQDLVDCDGRRGEREAVARRLKLSSRVADAGRRQTREQCEGCAQARGAAGRDAQFHPPSALHARNDTRPHTNPHTQTRWDGLHADGTGDPTEFDRRTYSESRFSRTPFTV